MRKTIQIVFRLFNRLFGGNPWRGRDPYAGSRVRNKRGPKDRSAAVALAEPDDK